MLEVGRVCVKLAGREAGRHCVVVDVIDDAFVLIDGNVRRKRCNIAHLEPLDKVLNIKKNADTKTVLEAMKKEGFKVFEKREKKVKKEEKPYVKEEKKIAKEEKPKEEKKEAKKKEAKKVKK